MSNDPKSMVHKYLHDQNRPYSANDILLNLHKVSFWGTIAPKGTALSKSKQKFVGQHDIWAASTDVTSHL